MVISFFRAISFCDSDLDREKSGMAKFCRVMLRADGAKGLSNCVSRWFICNAGYKFAEGVIVISVEGDEGFKAWAIVCPIIRDDKVGFSHCWFMYCLVNF